MDDIWKDGMMLLCVNVSLWVVSLGLGKTWPVDFVWSSWPIVQGWLILMRQRGVGEDVPIWRAGCLVGLISIWGARLTFNFVRRGGIGHEDWRYADMRVAAGQHFWWSSLFSVFLGQSMFMFGGCTLCLVQLSPDISPHSKLADISPRSKLAPTLYACGPVRPSTTLPCHHTSALIDLAFHRPASLRCTQEPTAFRWPRCPRRHHLSGRDRSRGHSRPANGHIRCRAQGTQDGCGSARLWFVGVVAPPKLLRRASLVVGRLRLWGALGAVVGGGRTTCTLSADPVCVD